MGANPHRWYSPSDVATITMVIADDLSALRPTQRVQFHKRAQRFLEVTLAAYTATRRRITDQFAHTPVGASESIFSPLVAELSLNLATPARFLRSVSEGGEPTARDLSVITDQIRHHRIAVYLENVQNITPAVAEQVTLARSVSPPIPVVAMTETPPVHQSFARWQTRQLQVLFAALKEAHP
jgi:zinc/manganese transport system substrate-binding protein